MTQTRPFTKEGGDVEQGDEIQQLDWDTSIMPSSSSLPLLPFLASSSLSQCHLIKSWCVSSNLSYRGDYSHRIHRDNKTLWEEGKINRTLQRKELETVVERRGNGNGKKSMNARAAGRHPSTYPVIAAAAPPLLDIFSILPSSLHPLLSANTVITGYKNIPEFPSSHLLMITWPKLQTTSCRSA